MSEITDITVLTSEKYNCYTVSTSNNVQQEVNDLIQIIKQEREKYFINNMLLEAVEQALKDNLICGDLKLKVKKILMTTNLQPYLEIQHLSECCNNVNDSQQESLTIFGLSQMSSPDLDYEEQYNLKRVVQKVLNDKNSNLKCDLAKRTGQIVDSLVVQPSTGLHLNVQDKILFEEKTKLNEEQNQYYCNLLQYFHILENFVELRLEFLPKLCQKKLKECSILNKMYGLRAEMLNAKINSAIFAETPTSLVSYKELLNDLKHEQENIKTDIQKLEEYKQKYSIVSCKQYNEILSSYKQYKSGCNKLKKLQENLSQVR